MFSGLLFLKNSYRSGEKVKFHPPLRQRSAAIGTSASDSECRARQSAHDRVLDHSHPRPAQRGRFVKLPSALPHKAVADVKGVLVNDRLFLVYDR